MGPRSPVCLYGVVFFSSRRRHTRFKCDWSSDVCSSDLMIRRPPRSTLFPYQPAERQFKITRGVLERLARCEGLSFGIITKSPLVARDIDVLRSEERRVGKEGRSRGGPDH